MRANKEQNTTTVDDKKYIQYVLVKVIGQVPSKSNGYRIAKGRLIKSEQVREYEKSFYLQSIIYKNLGIEGNFEFHAKVYFKTNQSDVDGSLKIILDCLQKINAISNDKNCQKIVIEKFLDKNNPRIEFYLVESLKII